MKVNKIKAAMAEAGYNQCNLANAMNMSKNTLNAKINGKSRLFIDEALTLCQLLGIPHEKMADIFLS